MTAIGIVGIEDGFVLAADGRATVDNEEKRTATPMEILQKESESAQKIFSVVDQNKILGYAVTGFVTLDKFNLLDEIKRKMNWLSGRDYDTSKDYLISVASRLTDELNEAKQTGIIKDFPVFQKMEAGERWKIADIIVVGYFKGMASFVCGQIFHADDLKAKFDVNSVAAKCRLLSGSGAVRKAMYPEPPNEPDPRFAQYAKQIIGSLEDAELYVKAFPPPQVGPGPLLYPAYVRGQALLLLHEGAAAANEFQKILDHRNMLGNSPLFPLAHLQLARARSLSGDAPGARKSYQDFFAFWKDADPDIPGLSTNYGPRTCRGGVVGVMGI